eukprot:352421-Chlamydomonas_euryale.AAC.84
MVAVSLGQTCWLHVPRWRFLPPMHKVSARRRAAAILASPSSSLQNQQPRQGAELFRHADAVSSEASPLGWQMLPASLSPDGTIKVSQVENQRIYNRRLVAEEAKIKE